MSIELGRRLIAAGAVHPSEIEAAFYRQLIGQIPFVRALLELGHVTEEVLEQELTNSMVPFLATIVPLPAIVDELPNQMCRRLMAVPVRRDPRTGLIDVAAVDPFDAHIPYEFSYHLKSEVRVLRASLAAIEQALSRIDRGEYSASVILRKSVRPPGYATPSVPPLRSDRPIPLVRKSKRGQQVEVRAVRNVAGPPPDEKQGPADFRSPQVPGAPSMPTFAGGQPQPQPVLRARQQTAPGPPGVPKRQEPPHHAPHHPPHPPPVPASVRARPEVPVSVPSARGRPEVPGTPKGRSETPGASPPSSKAVTSSNSPSSRSSSSSSSASANQPRPETRGGPPPPPPKAPTPVTAASGAKARPGTSGRPPPAPAPSSASSAPSPPKASASSTAATRARPESSGASSTAPAHAAESAKGRSSSSPPPTTRGPFSPKAPKAPFADIRGVLAAMEAATTRDDVIDCLIVGMSTVARRVGVFAVKKGHYKGVACNAALGDPARFRAIEISTEATTVLGIAATSGSYLGPLPVTQPHEDLLAFMKDASHEVTASLIRVAGRPAVILFAEGLGDTMIVTRRAEELGHEASLAFSRILTDAKASRGRA